MISRLIADIVKVQVQHEEPAGAAKVKAGMKRLVGSAQGLACGIARNVAAGKFILVGVKEDVSSVLHVKVSGLVHVTVAGGGIA